MKRKRNKHIFEKIELEVLKISYTCIHWFLMKGGVNDTPIF